MLRLSFEKHQYCIYYLGLIMLQRCSYFVFQAVAFMLADMAIGVESARLCYQKAAWMADQVNSDDVIIDENY